MNEAKIRFSSEKLYVSTELMRAIAHPLRLKILEYIDQNERIKVNSIYGHLQIEQSLTSQHLKILKTAGVVSAMKEGKFMFYSINYPIIDRVNNAMINFLKAEKPIGKA